MLRWRRYRLFCWSGRWSFSFRRRFSRCGRRRCFLVFRFAFGRRGRRRRRQSFLLFWRGPWRWSRRRFLLPVFATRCWRRLKDFFDLCAQRFFSWNCDISCSESQNQEQNPFHKSKRAINAVVSGVLSGDSHAIIRSDALRTAHATATDLRARAPVLAQGYGVVGEQEQADESVRELLEDGFVKARGKFSLGE